MSILSIRVNSGECVGNRTVVFGQQATKARVPHDEGSHDAYSSRQPYSIREYHAAEGSATEWPKDHGQGATDAAGAATTTGSGGGFGRTPGGDSTALPPSTSEQS